ncbi:hypothetical protein G6F40_016301 [Rhizopus arrhizus]|nr:hypothetical protein G6F40_016301 [Rhizopus arrhizus]
MAVACGALPVGSSSSESMKSRWRAWIALRTSNSKPNRPSQRSPDPPPTTCTRWLSPPPCWVPPARTLTSTPSKWSLRMMLTTPAMASEPYTADAPAASTSMRSISALGMLARLTTFTEPS